MALVFLIAGVSLLLWAWGSWVYRTHAPPAIPLDPAINGVPAGAEPPAPIGAIPIIVVTTALMVAVIALAYRAMKTRKHPPSPLDRNPDSPFDDW